MGAATERVDLERANAERKSAYAILAASGARFPCLRLITMPRKRMLQLLRRRFKSYKSAFKLRRYANSMIDEAYDNFWTRTYAKFQLLTNGIPP